MACVRPFIGCCKIIHHPCTPFFRLRGSLRGCRSEIRLLDLAPSTILCAKHRWVKRRDGVVAAPPCSSSGCRTRLSLDATYLFPRPCLGGGESTSVVRTSLGNPPKTLELRLDPRLGCFYCTSWERGLAEPSCGSTTTPSRPSSLERLPKFVLDVRNQELMYRGLLRDGSSFP
ncbi:unnamed protein product [Ectocarpus sp. 12 AP-2014]